MKTVFNSLDVAASVKELQKLIGMRINQIYDIDHKSYLFKLQKAGGDKSVLLIESGSRTHTTQYSWSKNDFPSGFTMKLRKHLVNKRVLSIKQSSMDRIITFQFGSGEAANHLIVELFNRGNIILTDGNFMIISVLTPHTEGKAEEDKVKFTVNEIYPLNRSKEHHALDKQTLTEKIRSFPKQDTNIVKFLLPLTDFGAALLEHVLILSGLSKKSVLQDIDKDKMEILASNVAKGDEILKEISEKPSKGFVIKDIIKNDLTGETVEKYLEFHPYLFKQHQDSAYSEYDTFDLAVDEYFSKLQAQSSEIKILQQQKEAMKKVEKIKNDQQSRIKELINKQEEDRLKAELIIFNVEIVDLAIVDINAAIASQIPWLEIEDLVKEARRHNHPLGKVIKKLKLEMNAISLFLTAQINDKEESRLVDIDLDITAHANAKRYFDSKKYAAHKEKKTVESKDKAIQSASRKAKMVLKDIKTMASVSKVQKPLWFQKFYWFISSENYLVIGGRDQQQNELVVKRHLNQNDIYVHADIHGASNVIIKNPTGCAVPFKTLEEAGTLAVCCSSGWNSKVLCSAWWVKHDQVSKTAPTGEYLSTGSFMVRGQKNFLTPAQLSLGCAVLFKIADSSVERHTNERIVRSTETTLDTNKPEATEEFEDVEDNSEDEQPNQPPITQEPPIDLNDVDPKDEPLDCEINDNEFEKNSAHDKLSDEEDSDDEQSSLETKDENTTVTTENMADIKENSLSKNPKSKQSSVHFKEPNEQQQKEESTGSKSNEEKTQKLKRGQKGKLKKIKEKYKDQDDEEKFLRMSILKPDGEKKFTKKELKMRKNMKIKGDPVAKKPGSGPVQRSINYDEETPIVTDLSVLQTLTGEPVAEDELLYAVPVVAPYSTVLSYKYKVKVTPGTSKRGKAAKLAVETFVKNKESTQREKDLIKVIDIQGFIQNFPGTLKVSVPVQKTKKKNQQKKTNKDT